MEQLEYNTSFQEIFIDIEVKEEEKLPDYVILSCLSVGRTVMEVFSPITLPPHHHHLLRSSPPTILRQIIHQFSSQLCVPQVPPAPGFNQVQGQRSEAGVTVDCAGGGQVPGHGVWGPAGAVGPASCAREDQTGGDDCQHPDTR